jgi:hypothetical protein
MDDPVILIQDKLGASIYRRRRIFVEPHHHFPLEKDLPGIHSHGADLHIQLFTALGEPLAHRFKFFHALDPLDAVLEDDVLMIIRENMRPVRFAIRVVSPGPKFAKQFGGECFHL